jgi:response regulator RpfG family c-di-GMP phosphodiesterase
MAAMLSEGSSILVVDDEAVIRDLMTEILTDEGFDVVAAPGGTEALNNLRDRRDFKLLFTDIMMPEMDGIQLIREARRIAPSMIPIVMTGYATLESARAAVREGAYDYVLKPFSLSEIKLAIHNALERHRLVSDNARLRDLTELFQISEQIATIHEEQRLFQFILKAALERVEALRGSIMLSTEDGRALTMAAHIGLPEDVDTEVDYGKSIAGWVAQNNLPLCVQDIARNPDLNRMSLKLEDASFISVPIQRSPHGASLLRPAHRRAQSPVVAVLNVNRKKDGLAFTDSDLKALSIIGKHASVALENVHLLKDLESAHLETLQSMALILEAKDPYTHGHSERVRNYSVLAAMKLGMRDEDIQTMRLGAMLHDVGKIGVSDSVLNKVDKLTDEEWDAIKRHPIIGYNVLEPVGFITKQHLALVRSHHERLDGSGYPDGLDASQIDDLVRIIAVADTYDAMSGDRAYRKELPTEKILEELKFCSEQKSRLDSRVTRLFIEMIESGEILKYQNRMPGEEVRSQ